MEKRIVECTEGRRRDRPRTLREYGIERIVGRRIQEYCNHLGSYGMGGPGFAGFRLGETEFLPEEWLVLTLWGADGWLLLDGRWVAAHPNQYDNQRPLMSEFDPTWDDFTPQVLGAVIANAQVGDEETVIELYRDCGRRLRLEVPSDPSRLSLYGGSLEPRTWSPTESHLDAWLLSRHGDLYC